MPLLFRNYAPVRGTRNGTASTQIPEINNNFTYARHTNQTYKKIPHIHWQNLFFTSEQHLPTDTLRHYLEQRCEVNNLCNVCAGDIAGKRKSYLVTLLLPILYLLVKNHTVAQTT